MDTSWVHYCCTTTGTPTFPFHRSDLNYKPRASQPVFAQLDQNHSHLLEGRVEGRLDPLYYSKKYLHPFIQHPFFFFFFFLGPHPWHMEVPRLGVQSELQLPAYARATATRDLSRICDLHHSSRQCRILNPLQGQGLYPQPHGS